MKKGKQLAECDPHQEQPQPIPRGNKHDAPSVLLLRARSWASPVSLGRGALGYSRRVCCKLAMFTCSAPGTVSSVESGSPGEVQGQVLGRLTLAQNGVQSHGEGNLVEHQ